MPRRSAPVRSFLTRTGVGVALAAAIGAFLVWLGFLAWLAVAAFAWFARLLF